jgi:hypothetical protein
MNRSARGAVVAATTAIAASLVVGVAVAPSYAENKNLGTLDATCDGQPVLFEGVAVGAFPAVLHVVGSTTSFTIHQLTLIPHDGGDAIVIKNSNGVAQNKQLVSCSHAGNNFDFIWTGFFTPAG